MHSVQLITASMTPPGGLSDVALSYIKKIFLIENNLRSCNLSDEEFVKQRRQQVEPVLRELKKWLVEFIPQVTPSSSLLYKAMQCTVNQWDKLEAYLEHPQLRPDNTEIERIIKQFVIGRKNWLFSYSPLGAHSSATLYTFVQCAEANGLNAYAYMKYLFTVFPTTPPERYAELLPYRIDADLLKQTQTG